jgi:hypothetical protein
VQQVRAGHGPGVSESNLLPFCYSLGRIGVPQFPFVGHFHWCALRSRKTTEGCTALVLGLYLDVGWSWGSGGSLAHGATDTMLLLLCCRGSVVAVWICDIKCPSCDNGHVDVCAVVAMS